MDVMIGKIMTASTSDTVAMVRGGFEMEPLAGSDAKSGIHPKYLLTQLQKP